jgi:hypothetical protein
LSLGTTLAGLTGLAGIWTGGFGCIRALQDHLDQDAVPLGPLGSLEPALRLLPSSCAIGLGLLFLAVSYGLDRGRGWSRHLILTGWLAALLLVAFGWERSHPLQRQLLLGTAGFTLLATAYFYVKPNVVAYYRRPGRGAGG